MEDRARDIKSEFKDFYEQKLFKHLEAIEPERRKKNSMKWLGWLILLIGITISLYLRVKLYDPYLIILPALVAFIIKYSIDPKNKKKSKSNARKVYKNKVIKPMIKFVNPDLNYRVKPGIKKDEFNLCPMFEHADRFQSEDLIYGCYKNVDFKFAEVQSMVKTESREDGKTVVDWDIDFEGTLFIAPINRTFKGRYFMSVDSSVYRGFSRLMDTIMKKKSSRIKLEDPRFEDEFDVFGSDQIEGRVLFTTSFMERCMKLKERIGPYRLCFSHGTLYIGILEKIDFLDLDIDQSCTDYNRNEEVMMRIKAYSEIPKTLHLDLDIYK